MHDNNAEPTSPLFNKCNHTVSVTCYLSSQTGFERGCAPEGGGSSGDPESRREIGCGLDEAACEFPDTGHGSFFWKLKARTLHARGHKI